MPPSRLTRGPSGRASTSDNDKAKKSQHTKLETKAPAAQAPADEGDVLLGHFISKCVGIQHYRGNGIRYNKEPLHLKRDPYNPYDRNAVAVRTAMGGKQVGHMQRLDALAVARVADDSSMRIRMVAQVCLHRSPSFDSVLSWICCL